MYTEVAPGKVLARSLADWSAYWDALEPLTKAQRRWRDFERELRINCVAQGCGVPDADDPIIAEIRCGKWEKRQRTIGRNMMRDRAKVALWKRDGYTLDAEHRLVAPEPRESGSRPRERRSRRRNGTVRRTRAGASRDGPGSSEADDEPHPVGLLVGFCDGFGETEPSPSAPRRGSEDRMSRENARAKGVRYLGEGRLMVLHVDPERIRAECRGAGAVYWLRWTEREGWACSCPCRGRCSHLWALLNVTVREAAL